MAIKNLIISVLCFLGAASQVAASEPLKAVLLNTSEIETLGLKYDSDFLCQTLSTECLALTFVDYWMLLEVTDGLDRGHPGGLILLTRPLYKISKKIKEDKVRLKSELEKYAHGIIDFSTFEKDVLESPRGFADLPKLFAGASKTAPDFDQVIFKALLLTIDGLYKVANSDQSTYPYRDQLAPSESLLDISVLFERLSAIGEWPKFQALTLEARAKFGQKYLEKTKSGRFRTKGFYSARTNTVWLDLTQDFFENVYVLYHELFHVAFSHSTEYQATVNEVMENLQTDHLTEALLKHVSVSELLAFDQQVRFFHATRYLVSQWDDSDGTASTLAWHDSLLGGKYEKGFLSRNERKLSTDWYMDHLSVLGGIMEFGSLVFQVPTTLVKRAIFSGIDDKYRQERLEIHQKKFEQIYLQRELNLTTKDIQPVGYSPQNLHLSQPKTVSLTADDILHIKNALGPGWAYGIPFSYTTMSVDPQDHDGHGGNEGTHGGNEGTHGGDDGFPSLDGDQP